MLIIIMLDPLLVQRKIYFVQVWVVVLGHNLLMQRFEIYIYANLYDIKNDIETQRFFDVMVMDHVEQQNLL